MCSAILRRTTRSQMYVLDFVAGKCNTNQPATATSIVCTHDGDAVPSPYNHQDPVRFRPSATFIDADDRRPIRVHIPFDGAAKCCNEQYSTCTKGQKNMILSALFQRERSVRVCGGGGWGIEQSSVSREPASHANFPQNFACVRHTLRV